MFVNDRRSEKQTALGSGIDVLDIYTLHITVSSIFRVRHSYCTRKFSFKCSEGSLHENEKGVFFFRNCSAGASDLGEDA